MRGGYLVAKQNLSTVSMRSNQPFGMGDMHISSLGHEAYDRQQSIRCD